MSEDLGWLGAVDRGSVVAGYRVESRLGAGGMAIVFRARDEPLGRMVALKVMAPQYAQDAQFRQRFIAESRAAAAVDDPHIIPIYEANEANGLLYIAMRLVNGPDLRDMVHREGAMPPARVLELLSPVASALDSAHEVGLIHRDVKPANILVHQRTGHPDHVYLADFGLSKSAATGAVSLTGTGQFLGTPHYSSPEQCQGGPVDGKTDQYALACVAYEMFTGHVPFERDDGLAILLAHVSDPPPPLTGQRPELPAAADQVMAKALAKSSRDRYDTCQDFTRALRDALGPVPYRLRNAELRAGQYAGPTLDGGSAAPAAEPSGRASDRVQRLLREARSIARSVPDEFEREPLLTMVEQAKARVAPDSAQAATAASLDDTEALAQAIAEKRKKSLALASVAIKVANTVRDPDRVTRLLSQAEMVALSIRDSYYQSPALAGVARAFATIDPQQAARVAMSIPDKEERALALADLAGRDAEGAGSDLADRLLSEAETVARSIRARETQSRALAGVARAFAAFDSQQAGRVALSIRSRVQQADCLADITKAVLAADPDQAEHFARAITEKPQRAAALASVAARMARDLPAADAGRVDQLLSEAERTAESIGRNNRSSALIQVALEIASTAPDRAARLAFTLSDPWQKARILAHIAQAMPHGDPRRIQLVGDMHRITGQAADKLSHYQIGQGIGRTPQVTAVRDIAEAMASIAPDLAISFAQPMKDDAWKAYSLACVARGLATGDPARADRLMLDVERIIRAITDKSQQVKILLRIAEAWARERRLDHGLRPANA